MHSRNVNITMTRLSVAVQAAVIAMAFLPLGSHAADDSAEDLTQPVNTVEIGYGGVTTDSAKFGEYSGLNKASGNAIVNISARGGDAYGAGTGTRRWEIKASDLGTTSREIGLSISEQGQWAVGLNYDELQHNLSDTYQTPYTGSAGGNAFTLPGFGLAANTTTLSPAQLAAYHNLTIDTSRKNTSVNASMAFSPRIGVKLDLNHLDQTGSKLMAFGSAAFGSTPAPSGEAVAILPNPTKYVTDTLNLAVNWHGDGAHLTAAYFGSFFREGYDRVNFTTFAGANNVQAMSTPPSNDFHQLNVTGGYTLTPTTKLTGGVSYARNTQNDPFVVDSFMFISPSAATGNTNLSLNGVVVSSHADVKLTNQTNQDLTVSASLKYDLRDNQTQSLIYNFQAIGANNIANYPNTPLSTRKNQFEVAGDYRLNRNQRLHLAYDREDVTRWCNSYAVGGSNYPAGTNCVVAMATSDDKLSATYKITASEELKGSLGYTYGKRKTTSDPNAIAAMIGVRGGDTGTTVGTIKGLNGGDYLGFYPFFDASKTQQVLKTGINWQANDKLSVAASGRYTDDKYDSTYGVLNGNSWSLSLDASYNYSDSATVNAYVTQQVNQRDLTDEQRSLAQGLSAATAAAIAIPAGATWSNKLKNDDMTLGIGAKKSGLMAGKLELIGDLSFSLGKSNYTTLLNYSTTTTGGVSCTDPRIYTCGSLPDIKNELLSLKINGVYKVNKSSRLGIGYQYQQLISSDYYFNGLAYANTATSMLATNQQAPNYAVSALSIAYIHDF